LTRTSLLDVLVGQRVRLVVSLEKGDRAKGDEPTLSDVEMVGDLLHLPEVFETPGTFEHHSLRGEDGKRQPVMDDDVRRVEVLDPVKDEVLLFARCTAELEEDQVFTRRRYRHQSGQCPVHEIHGVERGGRRVLGD
jgi:hypothetical protein